MLPSATIGCCDGKVLHLLGDDVGPYADVETLDEVSMAQTKKKQAPVEPPLGDDELSARVRAALSESALKSTELVKKLGKRDGARAVDLARELARNKAVHRLLKGKTEWFFGVDPVVTLDRVVSDVLRREGPLDAPKLKKAVQKEAPGHDGLFAEWLKSALSRSVLYERPGKPKTLGLEPDLKSLLKKPLADLKKQVVALEGKGISRELIAGFLQSELGWASGEAAARPASSQSPSASQSSSREVFLKALHGLAADNPQGALLPLPELRDRAGLAKRDFDAAALALSREGLLVLHHHDHASALSEADQDALVRDALGRHYVGVALRGAT